ncbi:MAG: hypothetical protein IPM51_08250 [Sphingobacteriaceae bacterium]|nr:hypothetical protein [Sphingobacteriaceae bacterium]
MNSFWLKCRSFVNSKYFALLIILIIAIPVCIVAKKNVIWLGDADNYWHYYFSKYAFQFPKFFLHHWGKPFFILLTAPVSHFGFYALNLFNILCGLSSAYLLFKWSKLLNYRFAFFAIILLMAAPIYLSAVQSALTEPLFSFILLASSFLFFKEKYFWGALLASTLMYTRTEGLLIMPIYAFYLLIRKEWKYIPLLATTFIIYSFIGLLAGRGFLWYFTENPYNPVSPYGHGTWNHFIIRYDYSFGLPLLLLFFIGLFIIIGKMVLNKDYIFWKAKSNEFKIFCLAFVPSLTFFAFHAYAWYAGKYASAGLERVMASIVPLVVIVAMGGVNILASIRFNLIRIPLFMVYFYFLQDATFLHFSYPTTAYGAEKVEMEAAQWFTKIREPGSKIYYAHPAFVFYADYNPFDEDNKECFGFPNSNCIPYEGNQKFYYIWDSWFCESSCGNKLSDIENCPNLKKMREFKDGDLFHLVFFESK